MATRHSHVNLLRGEVYLVNFNPTIGAEIRKTHPTLIIQNNIANRHSPITIVAAITSAFDESLYPTEVRIRPPEAGLATESVVLLNQVRSIDKLRLVRRLGILSDASMEQVDRALLVSLGLVKL